MSVENLPWLGRIYHLAMEMSTGGYEVRNPNVEFLEITWVYTNCLITESVDRISLCSPHFRQALPSKKSRLIEVLVKFAKTAQCYTGIHWI